MNGKLLYNIKRIAISYECRVIFRKSHGNLLHGILLASVEDMHCIPITVTVIR